MGVRKYYYLVFLIRIYLYIFILYICSYFHMYAVATLWTGFKVWFLGDGAGGGGSISKKRSWCLLSPENIHTKVPSRIETASQTQNSSPHFLFFSHPRLLAPCPAEQDRSSLMSVLPPSSDQSISLTEKVYVSLSSWLLPNITSISKKYVWVYIHTHIYLHIYVFGS